MKKTLFLLMLLFPMVAMSQEYTSSSDKPFWTKGYFREMANSYLEVVSAFDYDMQGARTKAVEEIIKRRSTATGTQAKVTMDGSNVNVTAGHELIVKARVIDEYIHHTTGGYTVYLLVQTAKNPTYPYESVTFTTDYGCGARPLVPGMAQLYKGSKGKAAVIISAQALSVASIILCESQRSTYHKKAVEQPRYTKEYISKADNWEIGRNISIGVAAGVYIYNLIDGFAAKGKRKIKVGKVEGGGLSVMPYATTQSAGMSFAYQF